MYYRAPLFNVDTQVWSHREFETKKDVLRYLETQIKYPGEYNIQHAAGVWNEQGLLWTKQGYYNTFITNSIDFRKHWDAEKEKCKLDGFIIYESDSYEQAIPCLYYWYLNYTPIYDKMKKKIAFGDIWDGDLHTYFAILMCLLEGKHFVCLKKRQFGMSFKITSILLNGAWFSEAAKIKMFSYAGVHTENSWIFLEQFRDHINKFCGWNRGFDPNRFMDWQIRRRRTDGTYVGNMSIVKGLSTEKDASKPVGGGITLMFGEEAGINPTLDTTHEYSLPAVGMGGLTTGLLMYSGSVGELDKCEPLKKFMFKPANDQFKSFPNLCEGDEDLGPDVGFFVPEWWNYISLDTETLEEIKCYDKNGNTNKAYAMELITENRRIAMSKDAESYRYYCSQRPLSIKEAFSYRKDSIFPQKLLAKQEYRIDRNDYKFRVYDIERDGNGKPIFVKATHPTIEQFPFNPKKNEIPYGAIKVWEDPVENSKFGTYFAAVDPIAVDVTSTSESLFSVVIYKNITEIQYVEEGVTKIRVEGDRIVAAYVGRKETVLKTNELGELLIEKYNAFAVVENNVDNFIKHMITKHKQKYLATKADLPFLKEIDTNSTSYQEYGVRTNTAMWAHYINKILEYLKEEINVETKSNGEVVKTTYGVERIPDARTIKELINFTDTKGNYDQIVTLGLVIALAKSRQANGLITKIVDESIVVQKVNYSKPTSPFKSIGSTRNPFKNLK